MESLADYKSKLSVSQEKKNKVNQLTNQKKKRNHLYSFYRESGFFIATFGTVFDRKNFWSGVHSLQTRSWFHGCYGKVNLVTVSPTFLVLNPKDFITSKKLLIALSRN